MRISNFKSQIILKFEILRFEIDLESYFEAALTRRAIRDFFRATVFL